MPLRPSSVTLRSNQAGKMSKLTTYLRAIAAIVILAALLGCGGPELKPIPEDGTILAFGDSLTVGVGTTGKNSYPSVLAALTERTVINAGVSGETTDKGALRLPEELDDAEPDLVIIIEGGNDLLQNRDHSAIKTNLKSMIETAQSRGVQVVLIGVPQMKLLSNCAPLYEELADEFQLVFDGTLLAGLLRSPSLKSDYIHLNEKGYRTMAESIYKLLKENGAL
jgi:lysophospholipase L1-like esterase